MNKKLYELLKEGYKVEFEKIDVLASVFCIIVTLKKEKEYHSTVISEENFQDKTYVKECLNMLRKEFLHDESRGCAGN